MEFEIVYLLDAAESRDNFEAKTPGDLRNTTGMVHSLVRTLNSLGLRWIGVLSQQLWFFVDIYIYIFFVANPRWWGKIAGPGFFVWDDRSSRSVATGSWRRFLLPILELLGEDLDQVKPDAWAYRAMERLLEWAAGVGTDQNSGVDPRMYRNYILYLKPHQLVIKSQKWHFVNVCCQGRYTRLRPICSGESAACRPL